MVRPLAPALILAVTLAGPASSAPTEDIPAALSRKPLPTDHAVLTPTPRAGEWLEGLGSATPVTVVRLKDAKSKEAKALLRAFRDRLPEAGLPAEGYLLEVGSAGALVIAKDDLGALRAAQTLRQLPQDSGGCPRIRVADWPDLQVRGLHVLDSGAGSLPILLRLIHEVLALRKCNLLVYEIDYNYHFVSHPEMSAPEGWTRTQVGELVRACRAEGIRLIPQINCLGHQGWGLASKGALLDRHPEFEELPDGKIPMTSTTSGGFYCHSWCPLAPGCHALVLDLADELVDAFESDAFHVGMDEVFVIASDNCPRCKGRDPAELFAKAVNDFHDHLKARGKQMFMWGDRLIDGKKLDLGEWDASQNGTPPAIDKVSRDIVICDWHYDERKSYPSVPMFTAKGFTVLPTVYSSLRGERAFMAQTRHKRRVPGVLTSIWMPADRMATAILDSQDKPRHRRRHREDDGDDSPGIATTAVIGLDDAWAGPPKDRITFKPEKAGFLGSVKVTMKSSVPGTIRYTLDGSPPGPSSSRYLGSITLTSSAVIVASVVTGKDTALWLAGHAYERLIPREPDGAAALTPGLNWAAYLSPEAGWERMPDFATLTPTGKGAATVFDLSMAPRELNYGVVFTGFLEVPRDGLYTFALSSDDGSQMWIGDRLVVDNDGLHQMEGQRGEIALKAGKHAIRVLFFQKEGGAGLELEWEGPGIGKRQMVPVKAYWRQ